MRLIKFFDKITEAKFSKPTMMYHGTSDVFLRNILSNGIEPNPGKKVWDTDPDASTYVQSRVSLQGSYWTGNLLTATGSAGRAKNKFGGNRILVIANLALQSSFADEDDINGKVNWAYADSLRRFKISTEVGAATMFGLLSGGYDGEIPGFAEKLPEMFAKEFHDRMKSSDKQPMDTKMLKQAFWVYFKRLLAHSKAEGSFNTMHGSSYVSQDDVNAIPDPNTAEKAWLDMREILTRRYTKTARGKEAQGDVNHTLRMPEPVTFKGGNKIIAIIGDNPNPTKESSYDEPKVLYYGDVTRDVEMFIDDYRTIIGQFPGLITTDGKEVYPSDREPVEQ